MCSEFQLVYPELPAMLNGSGELVLRNSFLFTSHFFLTTPSHESVYK